MHISTDIRLAQITKTHTHMCNINYYVVLKTNKRDVVFRVHQPTIEECYSTTFMSSTLKNKRQFSFPPLFQHRIERMKTLIFLKKNNTICRTTSSTIYIPIELFIIFFIVID